MTQILPPERPEPEPPEALEGWKAADLTDDEYVDQEFIEGWSPKIHDPDEDTATTLVRKFLT